MVPFYTRFRVHKKICVGVIDGNYKYDKPWYKSAVGIMNKTMFIVGFLTLFIGTSMSPSTGVEISSMNNQYPLQDGTWLYVGGNGPGNYTSIQDAIDNATDGDTVFVYRGTYCEFLSIEKTITLLGEEQNKTFLDVDPYGGIVIQVIDAPNVTINGFYFLNHFSAAETGGIFATHSPGLIICNISDCHHHVTDFGCRLISSNHCRISTSFFYYKTDCAIDIQNSSNVIISGNHIIGSVGNCVYSSGISLRNSEQITIINNCIERCTHYGVYLVDSYENDLRKNRIQHNNASGIFLHKANNNMIVNNEISSNDNKGMFIENSKMNALLENNIHDNGCESLFLNAFFNTWNNNFWGNWSTDKYVIKGRVYFERFNFFLPVWKIDWNPAEEPFDIPGLM